MTASPYLPWPPNLMQTSSEKAARDIGGGGGRGGMRGWERVEEAKEEEEVRNLNKVKEM